MAPSLLKSKALVRHTEYSSAGRSGPVPQARANTTEGWQSRAGSLGGGKLVAAGACAQDKRERLTRRLRPPYSAPSRDNREALVAAEGCRRYDSYRHLGEVARRRLQRGLSDAPSRFSYSDVGQIGPRMMTAKVTG